MHERARGHAHDRDAGGVATQHTTVRTVQASDATHYHVGGPQRGARVSAPVSIMSACPHVPVSMHGAGTHIRLDD